MLLDGIEEQWRPVTGSTTSGNPKAKEWRQAMSVISVENDPQSLTMTVMADLDATVERAWQLWADPRQFEQWWGPPGHSATVVHHDLRAGGRITFFMAGTKGDAMTARGRSSPPTRPATSSCAMLTSTPMAARTTGTR